MTKSRSDAEAAAVLAKVLGPGWKVEPAGKRPAEDLTPEGIQLVIAGCERVAPATQKQLDLF